jgi:ABC-type multidrug transport system fused ATPase/permease subunit
MINHGNDYINKGVTTTYASLYTSLYKRLMHLIESSKGVIGAGRIINFFTTDSTFVAEMLNVINNIWVAPLHLIISLVLLYLEVEWCSFICVAMIIIMAVCQALLMQLFVKLRFEKQRETDKRTKLLQEFFEGIRIVKYYAWERFAYNRIGEVRHQEIKVMSRALYLHSLHEFISVILPIITMLVVFAIYTTQIGDLSVSKVFTVISLFRLLRTPLWLFASAAIQISQAKASILRISNFFKLTETSQNLMTIEDKSYPVGQLAIENGVFAWETPETKKACEEFSVILSKRFGPPKKSVGPKDQTKDQTKDLTKITASAAEVSLVNKKDEETRSESYIILKDINIKVEPKSLVAIVGIVGSGKSSLTNAMIGEMIKLEGSVKYNGRLAFIAQNAWIMNGTLRENITMDQPFDEDKYNRTIKLCELTEDLQSFAKADLTEIGSKGINLSGGQRQRVAIARAVYSDADIYIIDDCLSALDPHVAKCIFNNVIMEALKDKTRIFVTHGMSYLKNLNNIVVMKNGQIIATGGYQDLKANCEEFKYLTLLDKEKKKKVEEEKVKKVKEEEKKAKETEDEDKDKDKEKLVQKTKVDEDKNKGKLIIAEHQESGRVKLGNYLLLFRYPGFVISFFCILSFLVEEVGSIMIDWWIGVWSDDKYDKSNSFYITVYGILSGGQAIITIIRSIIYVIFIMGLAKNTQMSLVWAILRAPLQWFDRTPVGRIMNRTCNDQSNIDTDLVWLLQGTLRMGLQIIGSVILIGVVTYYFFIILVVILVLYIYYYLYSIQAARDSRRIESMAKSPIFVQYEETLDGLSTIRAYKYIEMFDKRIIKKVNHAMDAYFMNTRCVRWLNFRVDVLSSLVVAGAFYLAVYQITEDVGASPEMLGLAMSQSLNVVYGIATFLVFYGMTDTRMSAIERIFEYVNSNPTEKDFDEPKPNNPAWPEQGEIEVKHLYLRYRNDLPFVIKDLNIKIAPKEKIGVAGRTGSGKSTLTLGFLRIMEAVDPENDITDEEKNTAEGMLRILEPRKGTIFIDGQDVAELGLHLLRKNVVIIPQDPVLFSGNVRSSLDPFSAGTNDRDEEMIQVLKKVKVLENIWTKIIGKAKEKKESMNNISNKDKLDSQACLNGDVNISPIENKLIFSEL